jgi:integrase
MSLTDLKCRQAKPKDKTFRLFDTGGLYLEVKPTGTKVWRLKYKFYGKEKSLTIGKYPAISLLAARIEKETAKTSLETGIDPASQKQESKRLRRFNQAQTFELVALEWHKKNYDTWSPNHAMHILSRLKQNVFPIIGQKPISLVTVQDILICMQKIEERKAYHMTRRVLQIIGQVMRYAVVTGRADRDFTSDLKGSLKKYKKGHYAAIEPDKLPDLMKAINKNEARLYKQTILAIKLLLLTFVRTSELINARWEEFDFEKSIWNIPAERMKMRLPHVVPLSKQVVDILNELGDFYGRNGYILPSIINMHKPISNNTILQGLGRLGYKKIMTGHGFRALAMSTLKEKLGYRHEVVDRQLAHLPKNKIDQAYDRATFIPDRIKMMQEWADYINTISMSQMCLIVN